MHRRGAQRAEEDGPPPPESAAHHHRPQFGDDQREGHQPDDQPDLRGRETSRLQIEWKDGLGDHDGEDQDRTDQAQEVDAEGHGDECTTGCRCGRPGGDRLPPPPQLWLSPFLPARIPSVIKPPLEALLDRVESKYALVIVAAKRARQLKEGALPLVDMDTTNPVTLALEEIAAGKIRYEAPRIGIK